MNMRSLYLMLTYIIGLVYNSQAQNVIYIDKNASGNNNGSSWANAYTSLSEAFLHVDTTLTVDSMLIAAGTYHPETSLYQPVVFYNDYRAFVITRSNLAIVGGYAPGGTAYNPDVYKTEITSKTLHLNDTVPSRTLIMIGKSRTETLKDIVLKNLTLKDASNAPYLHMNLILGDTTVNTSQLSALYTYNTDITVDNVIFKDNLRSTYGAYHIIEGNVNIINSTFIDNRNYSGALWMEYGANVHISNTTFLNNQGTSTIISAHNQSQLTMDKCTLDNNHINDDFNMGNIIYSSNKKFHFTNNLFINHADIETPITLGGIDTVIIENNIWSHNNHMHRSTNYDHNKSAILYLLESKYVNINNNTIVNNKINSVFKIIGDTSKITLKNNLVSHNTLKSNIVVNATNNNPIISSNNYFQYDSSNVANLNGYTFSDPKLGYIGNTYAESNYSLHFNSPLVNAGDSSDILSITDFNGNARIKGSNIDIGAIEKQTIYIQDSMVYLAALTTAKDNQKPLILACEDGEWTYYSTNNNPDSIAFGIKWSGNSAAKSIAKIYITVDNNHTIATNNFDTATAAIKRYWSVDLGTQDLYSTVDIRFFFSRNEITALKTHLSQTYTNILPEEWIISNTLFTNNQVKYNTVNNGNYEVINGTENPVNNINYKEFNNLTHLHGGTVTIKANSFHASTKPITTKNNIKIAPNPTKNIVTITNQNLIINNTKAIVTNIEGKIVMTFIVKPQITLDVSYLRQGIYLIQTIDGATYKIVKD